MILITGATGKVGRHIVADLIAAGAPARALTRQPAAARLPSQAELAAFDPGQPATLDAALDGVTSVLVNTTAVGASIGALMTAAARAGVSSAVMISSLTVRDEGAQPYAIGAQHKAIEDAIVGSGLTWTLLRCGGFAANTLAWAPSIRQQGVVRAPYGRAATALISERDVAAAVAAVLLGEGHAGSRYVLTGSESMTQVEQAQAIGEAIGRTLRFEELPADAFRQAVGAFVPAPVIEDKLRYFAQYIDQPAEISPDLEKLIGRPAITYPEWASEHAADFR